MAPPIPSFRDNLTYTKQPLTWSADITNGNSIFHYYPLKYKVILVTSTGAVYEPGTKTNITAPNVNDISETRKFYWGPGQFGTGSAITIIGFYLALDSATGTASPQPFLVLFDPYIVLKDTELFEFTLKYSWGPTI